MSFRLKENRDFWTGTALPPHWISPEQDNESPSDSWLLFLTQCSDLQVESSFPWAKMKQNSIIYLVTGSINKIKQASVYLDLTLSHGCPLAKAKIRCSESISRHKSPRIQAVKKHHLCPLKYKLFYLISFLI